VIAFGKNDTPDYGGKRGVAVKKNSVSRVARSHNDYISAVSIVELLDRESLA